jgi:hypothetical protein
MPFRSKVYISVADFESAGIAGQHNKTVRIANPLKCLVEHLIIFPVEISTFDIEKNEFLLAEMDIMKRENSS